MSESGTSEAPLAARRRVGVAGSAEALAAVEPLLESYERHFELSVLSSSGDPGDVDSLSGPASDDLDALLLLGGRRRAPGTVMPGPVWRNRRGRAVAVGWLPNVGATGLRRFALAAQRVRERANPGGPVALLGQWHPQYLNLADRIERLLGEEDGAPRVFRWTSDRMFREDVVDGLHGLAAAVYVGHGRPIGWVGYRGMRAKHFASDPPGEPLGALFSLCCLTASRRRTGLSFSESLPLMGVCAAAFGAIDHTLHTDNARWALRLCKAISGGARTVADAVLAALPPSPKAVANYRILGDPLAPIAAAPGALARASLIPCSP